MVDMLKNYIPSRISALLLIAGSVSAPLQAVLDIKCVYKHEKSGELAQKLKNQDPSVNIFEVLGEYGYPISNEELGRLITKELKSNPKIAHCTVDKYGNTLAHITACRGMDYALKLLLAQDADGYAQNVWGITPLGMSNLCSETASRLKGSDRIKDVQDKHGILKCVRPSLDSSMGEVLKSNSPIVNVFELLGEYGYPLMQLNEDELEEFLQLVAIQLKLNPELIHCAIDKHGNTLLHIAACLGITSLVRYLVGEEKDGVKVKNGWGFTPRELVEICKAHANR